ncbi:hypothetical protein BJX63DRAFT_424829 [Aspergillus granulosus]|uniref:Nucleoside phosphorylase domain-containing protein n=1 Tax=Aspergillus granulosus TaxID=176169 RepID=A0ABR4GYC1_9EURO
MAAAALNYWNSLLTLQSRLSNRLAKVTSSDWSLSNSPSQKRQNDTAFLEADLRYIFTTIPVILGPSFGSYDDIERHARQLLEVLNQIVNPALIETSRLLKQASEVTLGLAHQNADPHDVAALGKQYPKLGSLLTFLETSDTKFHFTIGQDSSLFSLPEGALGDATVKCVAQVKEALGTIAYEAKTQPRPSRSSLPTDESAISSSVAPENPTGQEDTVPRKYASVVINSIFKELRHRNCGKSHEIKLRVSDDWQTSARDVPLDMFLSCCMDRGGWHQVKCGSFEVAIDEARKDGICAAIQRAKEQGRSIYLFVDKNGLFDISDTMPSTPLSLAHFTSETLQDLLDQKALTRITPGDYLTRAAEKKLSSREKDIIALGLARCLMEFFDADIELASHGWKPESVFFLRCSRGYNRDRILYISLKPLGPTPYEHNPVRSASGVRPGNPILLSFAKLLLEIDNGEKMALEVKPESRDNLPTWGEMCDIVECVEKEGGGNYLQAVEGCLYLHIALRQLQKEAVGIPLSDILRKTIYEQVVRKLEAKVNPQSSMRKRRDYVSEIPIAKKLSLAPHVSSASASPVQAPPTKPSRPTSRYGFEIAVVCAIPLEFDAVTTLVDEFWDSDYGCADGDWNIYIHGRIGKFNVVLLVLPSMGKVSAATASASLRLSYPRLSLVLVTGICGGVPFPRTGEELLLGDIVISRHVVQYDLGRQYPDGYETKDTAEDRFGRASPSVRRLLTLLQTDIAREKMERLVAKYLQDLQTKALRKRRGSKYHYPGASQDRVFPPSYHHERRASHSLSIKPIMHKVRESVESYSLPCDEAGCDLGKIISRERVEQKQQLEKKGCILEAQAPSIFIGTIGSADTVMKSGEDRDRIANLYNLIAFEMEGAGLWDENPCVVIKAVCDYADSHKNKNWQHFAAATAASATKALLDFYIQRDTSR